VNFDKQITRWATQGVGRVLMFGRWWALTQRPRYHALPPHRIVAGYRVDFKRRQVVWSDPLVKPSLLARMRRAIGGVA